MSDDEKSAKFFTARDTVALGNAATHSIFPSGISFALLVESGILTGSGSDRESRVFEFSDRYAFSFGISTPPFFNAAVISAENSQAEECERAVNFRRGGQLVFHHNFHLCGFAEIGVFYICKYGGFKARYCAEHRFKRRDVRVG